MTANFGDLLRFFKYYMGSGLIDATVERRVQRELLHRKEFPTRLFFGAIGIGIMILMICLGVYIVVQLTPAAKTMAAAAAPSISG